MIFGKLGRQSLTNLGVLAARPGAVLVVLAYTALWFALDRETLGFNSVATLATFVMTLLIQRAEHRDSQAMHAKLDELLRSHSGASNHLTTIDDDEPEEIEKHRARHRND